MMLYLLKSCLVCPGDLVLEPGDIRCFQCGRRYYPPRPPEVPQGLLKLRKR